MGSTSIHPSSTSTSYYEETHEDHADAEVDHQAHDNVQDHHHHHHQPHQHHHIQVGST